MTLNYLRNYALYKIAEYERSIQMTKEDLKVGYVVKLRDGGLNMIFPIVDDKLSLLDKNGCYARLDHFNSDLTHSWENRESLDIVEVYGLSISTGMALKIETEGRELLWKREESTVEITLEEIAKLKGCKAEQIRIKE